MKAADHKPNIVFILVNNVGWGSFCREKGLSGSIYNLDGTYAWAADAQRKSPAR